MTTPSSSNPYLLIFKGHVPALKNDKRAVTNKKGDAVLVHSPEVSKWLKNQESSLHSQVKNNNYQTIMKPARVGVWADIYIYGPNAPKSYPRRDGDNMFTTLQETLQTADMPSGICGVMEDDSQISFGHYEIHYVKSEMLEGARVYVWERNPWHKPKQELIILLDYIEELAQIAAKPLYELPDDLFLDI